MSRTFFSINANDNFSADRKSTVWNIIQLLIEGTAKSFRGKSIFDPCFIYFKLNLIVRHQHIGNISRSRKPDSGTWRWILCKVWKVLKPINNTCISIMFSGILLPLIVYLSAPLFASFFPLVSETKEMVKHQKWTHREIWCRQFFKRQAKRPKSDLAVCSPADELLSPLSFAISKEAGSYWETRETFSFCL